MKRMKTDTEKVWCESADRFKYYDTRTGKERTRWWTKARTPGTVRASRMPGGSGFRNNWEG